MFTWFLQEAEPEGLVGPTVPLTALHQMLQNDWTQAGLRIVIAIGIALVLYFTLGAIVRYITGNTLSHRILKQLHKPSFVTILLGGVYMAIDVFRLDGQTTLLLYGLIMTSIIVIWLSVGVRIISNLRSLLPSMGRAKIGLYQLLQSSAKILLYVVAAYALLLSWGIDPAVWVATAGVAGIAIGFAAQATIGNMIDGMAISADQPYRLGDHIKLDTGERGKITAIGLRSTRILSRNDEEIIIPNSVMAVSKITNESGGGSAAHRIVIPVSVSYKSDLERVEQVINDAIVPLKEHLVYNNPDQLARVHFSDFADSGIIGDIKIWVRESEKNGIARHQIVKVVHKTLKDNQIEIPFPQRVIHHAAFEQEQNTTTA